MNNNIVTLAENIDVVDVASNFLNNPNTTAIALVGLASLLYMKVTELQKVAPIKDDPTRGSNYSDKTRYNDLCFYRKELEVKLQRIVTKKTITQAEAKIPEQWALDSEDRPIYTSSFMANHDKIVKIGEAVNGAEYPQSTLIASIIAKIGGLFSSLGKRYQWGHPDRVWAYQNYNPNNFEAMFFSDLVYLLSHHILMASSDKAREVTTVLIEYCKQVRKQVLIDRGKDSRGLCLDNKSQTHEPLTVLDEIISELEVLATNYNKEFLARTFNAQINQISGNFIKLIKETFSILHLLLNDTGDFNFQVDTFLREYDVKKNTKTMESWIYRTLSTSSIKSGDYESKEKVSLENVAELPYTLDMCKNNEDLTKAGFWSFIIRDNLVVQTPTLIEKNAASSFLDKVQELHILIIKLCFVRQSIIILSKVSSVFGEAWLYGEDEGKEPLCVMFAIIAEITNDLKAKIDGFWCSYSNKYQEFKVKNNQKIESSDPESRKYYYMEACVEKIKSLVAEITVTSGHINESMNDIIELKNRGRTYLSDLLHNLISYVEVTRLTFKNDDQLIKKLKEQLAKFNQENDAKVVNKSQCNDNTNQRVDNQNNIELSKNKLVDAATLGTFKAICNVLLSSKTSSLPGDLTFKTGRTFIDSNQKIFYDNIIGKCQAEIDSFRNPYWIVDFHWWYYHVFNNKTVKNTPQFIEFCAKLMKAINIINPSTNVVVTQMVVHSPDAMVLFNNFIQRYIIEQDRFFHFGVKSSLIAPSLTRVRRDENNIMIIFDNFSLELPLDEQSERIAALFQDDYDRILATEEKLNHANKVIIEKNELLKQKDKEYNILETGNNTLKENQEKLSKNYNDLKMENTQLLKTLGEQNNALQKAYMASNRSYIGYFWSFFSSESQVIKEKNTAHLSSVT